MSDEIQNIKTPAEFLGWLRARSAAQAVTRTPPTLIEMTVQALLDFERDTATKSSQQQLPKIMFTNVSKLERAFYQQVIRMATPAREICPTTLQCFILGSLLNNLVVWLDDDCGEGGLTWNEAEAKRLKVCIAVPVDCITMYQCLEWAQSHGGELTKISATK